MPPHTQFPQTTFISRCPQSLIYSLNVECLNGGRKGKGRGANRTSPNESKSAAGRQTHSANSENASDGETLGAVLFQTERERERESSEDESHNEM